MASEFLTVEDWGKPDRLAYGFATAPSDFCGFDIEDDKQLEIAKSESLGISINDALGLFGEAFDSVLTVRQIHSPSLLIVHASDPMVPDSDRIRCDGIITDRPGLLIGVKTADCLPVLLYDPVRSVVAAVHAGWRGCYEGIVGIAVERMISEFSCSASTIIAALGPCARSCCYEVSDELADLFIDEFGADVVHRVDGRPHLDLHATARLQLNQAGLYKRQISAFEHCTICSKSPRFYSWRRDQGKTGRLFNFIGIYR